MMEGNGLSITTKDHGVVYVCVCLVHVSMPGTQDRIITLATRALAPAACIPLPYFTLHIYSTVYSYSVRDYTHTHCLQLWCIKTHVLYLLSAEEDSRLHSLTKDIHCDPSN